MATEAAMFVTRREWARMMFAPTYTRDPEHAHPDMATMIDDINATRAALGDFKPMRIGWDLAHGIDWSVANYVAREVARLPLRVTRKG